MSYIKKHRRVSIAMAIYNCSDTLKEAIDSIIAQTYKDWELIMCDDGSHDNTLKIAKEYEEKYENILVIQNGENIGLPASLNHCVEHAQGEFIARMDGDDISLPERFEVEVSMLNAHPEFAIVSCAMINFDENGDWGVQRKPEYPTRNDFLYDSPICHAPCIMRKDALADVGYYTVRPDLRRGQDYFLWHKFYCKGYRAYNMQTPYYKMRDDQAAAARRGTNLSFRKRFASRWERAKVQWEIIGNLGFPFYKRFAVLRPLIIACLPQSIYIYLHKKGINKQKG